MVDEVTEAQISSNEETGAPKCATCGIKQPECSFCGTLLVTGEKAKCDKGNKLHMCPTCLEGLGKRAPAVKPSEIEDKLAGYN
jgi:hypothetical protein